MGSTAASATYHAYNQLIRTPSLHPLVRNHPPPLTELKSNAIPGHSATIESSAAAGQVFLIMRGIGFHTGKWVSNPVLRATTLRTTPLALSDSSSDMSLSYEESLLLHLIAIQQNIGRVKWDEYKRTGAGPGDGAVDDLIEEEQTPKEPLWKRIVKLLKILLPHVGLNILLLSYIAMGAVVFIWLEADHELESRRAKLLKIHSLYRRIINETFGLCASSINMTSVDSRLRPLLSELSRTHEYDDRFTDTGQLWQDETEDMHTRWSFAAAVLYALTVITSTGSRKL